MLEAGELAKLAYFNDIVVGAVCCRVDMQGAGRKVFVSFLINFTFLMKFFCTLTPFPSQLYIMTLGCLAPYRRLGIGTRMLEHVLNIVKEDGNYTSIFLHVQVILYVCQKLMDVDETFPESGTLCLPTPPI